MLETGDELRIEHTVHDGYTVLHPSGTLNVDSYPQMRDGLLKYAADIPSALIIVVDALCVEREHLLSVFSLVWMRVADWPAVPMTLVAHEPSRRQALQRSAVARYVPVHASVAESETSLGGPPQRHRIRTTLRDAATASATSRALVRDACGRWSVDDLTAEATLVATELVENALKHTNSDSALRLELRRGLLSIAVTDDSPSPAVLREANGRGLRLVAQVARVWGCTPTLTGGKVVWAVLSGQQRAALSGPEWVEYTG